MARELFANMKQNHKCLIVRRDPNDWVLGDGNIKLKATGNPNWTANYHFRELQEIAGFETDDCVIFSFQESFDAQMDRLIQDGQVPQAIVDWFTAQGYMDAVNSDDKLPHFHSSERFVGYNTGNGFNGNAAQDPCNAARKYGIVPWTAWPFDATITADTYFAAPPQSLFNLGQMFLAQIGGKNAIQYHCVYQGEDTVRSTMDAARTTAPLMLGVATTDGWNQAEPIPPPLGTPPNHCVDNDNGLGGLEIIEDHYIPYRKTLTLSYPIPQTFQMVLSVTPPPAPPVLPTHPTLVQENTWLANLYNWLLNLFVSVTPTGLKGRFEKFLKSIQK